jgi:peptidylprolyl isomerase
MKNGDWVKMDYVGRRALDNAVIETTYPEEARKAGIFQEDGVYEPGLVILGTKTTIEGLEDALLTMKDGESRTLELPPEKAFGLRDPTLVRVMPISEFRRREMEPRPGMMLEMDGRKAMVRSVNSGRVTLDFNHPLAGERVIYDVKVSGVVEGTKARAQELLARAVRGDASKHTSIELKGEVLNVRFGYEVAKDMNFIIAKTEFVSNVLRYMDEIKTIEATEEYSRKAMGSDAQGAKDDGHDHSHDHAGHKHAKE